MIKLFILSCGTNAGWHMVKTLRDKFSGEFRIVGTDTNDEQLVPCASMLDGYYKVPLTSDDDFVRTIELILDKERPEYILPSFDFDQQIFFNGSDILTRYEVRSLSTPRETLLMYVDKRRMYESMAAKGLPVPKCFSWEELVGDVQYVVKPVNGTGSVGVAVMNGAEIRKSVSCDGFLVQEKCARPEITMECFMYQGRFSSVCRERIQTKAGVCTKARVFKSPRLEAIGKQFAELFETPMFFNLQFMQSGAGEFVITDVNLRLAGGMGLSYAAGWDEVSAIAKVMLGRPVDDVMSTLLEFVPEQYVVRVYEDIQTKVEPKTVAFDFDGTLLDSRARHRLVMDDVLGEFNVEIDTSGLVAFKRCGGNNVDFLVSKGVSADVAKKIQQDWISKIEDFKYLAADVLYEDAEDLISRFAGWRKVLVTARNNEEGVARTLERLGIEKLFDTVHVVKPGSMCSLDKAQILKQEKALLFYGDTNSDYMASVAADVPFCYRECGFHSRDVVYSSNNNS